MNGCNVFSFHYVSATIQLTDSDWYLNPAKVYHRKQMFVKAFAYFVSGMGILWISSASATALDAKRSWTRL